MKIKAIKFRVSFLLLAVLLNITIAYILKYRSVSSQAVTLGYPFEWFTIYDVFKGSRPIQTSNVEIPGFAANVAFYYFIICAIYAFKSKVWKKTSKSKTQE